MPSPQYTIVQMVDFWTKEISTKCYFSLRCHWNKKSHCFLSETLLLYCRARATSALKRLSFFVVKKIIVFEPCQNFHYHSTSVNQSMFYFMSVHSMVILDNRSMSTVCPLPTGRHLFRTINKFLCIVPVKNRLIFNLYVFLIFSCHNFRNPQIRQHLRAAGTEYLDRCIPRPGRGRSPQRGQRG